MNDPKSLLSPVAPGGTIGILGGGQLGRMLALAAARLGLKAHIYCDEPDAPAFQVAAAATSAAFDDRASLATFASSCDAVTFEFENVPAASVEEVGRIVPTNPSAQALRIAQDRFEEKTFVERLGFRTPEFLAVNSSQEASLAFERLGSQAILKTRRLGYDGKGQTRVSDAGEAARAFDTLHVPSIVERFVGFDYEASVVAARAADGAFAAYDPSENAHAHHILRRSTVPARLDQAQTEKVRKIARAIADALGYVGVLAVEFFVTNEGGLLINEIAPRVHNSGHWTIDACTVSQFEQHIRAVAGWPLGDASRHSDAVMENLIGDEAASWPALAERKGALHLYGKSEAKPGRKMGHFTVLSPLTRR